MCYYAHCGIKEIGAIMKILWVDTETTGLDPMKNSLVQLSCIAEIDGKIEGSYNTYVRPFKGDIINKDALSVTGLTIDQLREFPEPELVYTEFKSFLREFVDPYRKNKTKDDKFVWGGHNTKFDIDFVQAFFIKNNDKYFGSFFNYRQIDTLRIADFLTYCGINFGDSHKLGDLCEFNKVVLNNAHNSMADIEASRNLAIKFRGMLKDVE